MLRGSTAWSRLIWIVIGRWLSAADARNLVKFAGTAPFGPFKAVIAGLDGASAQAQNILLKVLEEPPPTDPVHPGGHGPAAADDRVPLPGDHCPGGPAGLGAG